MTSEENKAVGDQIPGESTSAVVDENQQNNHPSETVEQILEPVGAKSDFKILETNDDILEILETGDITSEGSERQMFIEDDDVATYIGDMDLEMMDGEEEMEDDGEHLFEPTDEDRILSDSQHLMLLSQQMDMDNYGAGEWEEWSSTTTSTDVGHGGDEQKESINRDFYYYKIERLNRQLMLERMTNNYLHKKMAEYYRKRRMDYVLREPQIQITTQEKYNDKLDVLSELLKMSKREQARVVEETNELERQRNAKVTQFRKIFHTMQAKELETTRGMVFAKTGNSIPDKMVAQLLKRQKGQAKLLAELRLIFIKLKNQIARKQQVLLSLDDIGPDLHLMDYEQLKEDNINYKDRVEERDSELAKLREKCSLTMQALAHIREKNSMIVLDLETYSEHLEDVEADFFDARERLNDIKQEHDSYRKATIRIAEDAGLLFQPVLLRDMESALKLVSVKRAALDQLKETYYRSTEQTRAIRHNIEKLKDLKKGTMRLRAKPKRFVKTGPANR